MKKLALLLVLVMAACFMFVGCSQDKPEEKPTGSTPASQTQTPASDTGTTNPPASNPGSGTQNPPAVTGDVWQDFSSVASKGKGAIFSEKIGIFDIVNGKVATSSGKTVKEGSKSGTSFTGAVQLGKNGSATDKCMSFTVPEGKTTLELYVYSASSGTDGDFNVSVNGTVTVYPCVNSGITCVTVTVKGGDKVVLYGGSAVSTNVWGILIK